MASRRLMFTAAFLFVSGAIGFDMVGGSYAQNYGLQHIRYRLVVVAEECLEMVGVAVWNYALSRHLGALLAGSGGQVAVVIDNGTPNRK